MVPIVNDSKNELLVEKITELNKIALVEEEKALKVWKAKIVERDMPKYHEYIGKLANKYLNVRFGTFDKLSEHEKNLLGDMVLSRTRKLKVLVRLLHLICPTLATLTIYLGIGINSVLGDPIIACGIIFGALGSIFGSMRIEDSPVLKFLQYRKICFPEEKLLIERNGDGERPAGV